MTLTHNITFDIAALFVLLVLLLHYRGKHHKAVPVFELFYNLVEVTFAATWLDIGTILIESTDYTFPDWIVGLVNAVYLAVQAYVFVVFLLYLLEIVGVDIRRKKINLMAKFPFLILMVLFLLSIDLPIIFYIEDGVYYHGSMYFLIYVMIAIYLVSYAYVCFYASNRFVRKQLIGLWLFVICCISAEIIQMVVLKHLIINFAISLSLVILVYQVTDPNGTFDETGAMRKTAFLRHTSARVASGQSYTIIALRIQNADFIHRSFGDNRASTFFRAMVTYLYTLDTECLVMHSDDDGVYMLSVRGEDKETMEDLLAKIRKRMESPWITSEGRVHFTINYGVIFCPKNASDEISLTDTVAHMCNTLQKSESNQVVYAQNFSDLQKEYKIIEAIKKALLQQSFQVFYQPIYSTKKQKIMAAEALIRLFDDELGFISPEIFIPISEKEGYILEIGRFVFEKVCEFYTQSKLKTLGIDYIEVNLSPVQCMQHQLAEEFYEIMKRYGVTSEQVNFEITETSAIISYTKFNQNIEKFNEYGISLSLDDFGTGYSNLAYMYSIPFQYVKIDKSLLWAASDNEKAYLTLEQTVSLVKTLKMKLVCEGVETEEQVSMLRYLGCDYFQGYYFSRPVCDRDFLKYVNDFSLPTCCA